MRTETLPELVLRPATTGDLAALADLYLRARLAAVPSMPPPAHGPDVIRAQIGGWDLETLEVWLAEGVEGPVGFVSFTTAWLECLYVDPSHQRGGVGGVLLDVVKARRPHGFGLWVFESNRRARRFYARHGLVERELTDGSENEEGAPDLRLEWPVGGDH